MKKSFLLSACCSVLFFLHIPLSQAESLVDGMYLSDGDDRGLGKCTLLVSSIDQNHKYGDQAFELESSGDGACEWSAIGMSKSYAITAGLVSNAGSPAFVKITFPFGPAGGHLEVTTFDLDGTVRNTENFARVDKTEYSGG